MRPDFDEVFAGLMGSRDKIINEFEKDAYRAAGIFLPFLGERLLESAGLYYIGQATRGDWYATEEQCAANSLSWADEFVNFDGRPAEGGSLYGEKHRRFWRFCDRLCLKLFGSGMLATRRCWGWSNLLKIGLYNDGNQHGPAQWGHFMHGLQREACIACLRYELSLLKQSIIYVASRPDFGICQDAFGKDFWLAGQELNDTKVRVMLWDNENIVCHGPHPRWPGFTTAREEEVATHITSLYGKLS